MRILGRKQQLFDVNGDIIESGDTVVCVAGFCAPAPGGATGSITVSAGMTYRGDSPVVQLQPGLFMPAGATQQQRDAAYARATAAP